MAPRYTYRVRYYVATAWSFFTQADHSGEIEVVSEKGLPEFVAHVAAHGIEVEPGKTWVLPGAILEVSRVG